MKREDILNSITEIGTCEDEVQRRTLLTNLSENVGKVFDEVDTLNTNAETLQNDLDDTKVKLVAAQQENKRIFLKLAEDKKEVDAQSGETGIQQEEKKEYKSYKDLAKNYL